MNPQKAQTIHSDVFSPLLCPFTCGDVFIVFDLEEVLFFEDFVHLNGFGLGVLGALYGLGVWIFCSLTKEVFSFGGFGGLGAFGVFGFGMIVFVVLLV
jgi:hypothetical protein